MCTTVYNYFLRSKNRDKYDTAIPAALGMMPGRNRLAAMPTPSTTIPSVDRFDSSSFFISPFRLSISTFIWAALSLNPSSIRILCSCNTQTTRYVTAKFSSMLPSLYKRTLCCYKQNALENNKETLRKQLKGTFLLIICHMSQSHQLLPQFDSIMIVNELKISALFILMRLNWCSILILILHFYSLHYIINVFGFFYQLDHLLLKWNVTLSLMYSY